MRLYKIISGIILIGLLCLNNLQAQHRFDKVQVFDQEDGLPSNRVRSVQKGQNGFIWFTTVEGLCRFDGSQVKVYQYDPDDERSIFSNVGHSLLVMKDEVWVGTNLGISVLDLKTDQFRNYQLDKKGKRDSLSRDGAFGCRVLYKDSFFN